MNIQPQFTQAAQLVCDYYKVTFEQICSNRREKRPLEWVYPTWALILLLYDMDAGRFAVADYIGKKPDSVATLASKAKRISNTDDDFKNDMKLLRQYMQNPNLFAPRLKGKDFRELLTEEAPPKIERPKGEYSNRNIMNIHDYYANIAI